MSDQYGDDADEPMPLRTKVIAAAVAAVLLIIAAAVLMRVGSPAIGPDEAPPAGHYGLPCTWCHTISSDAPKADGR